MHLFQNLNMWASGCHYTAKNKNFLLKKFFSSYHTGLAHLGWIFKRKTSVGNLWQMRKWPYLSSCIMNQKTKVTLLSQTLKVEEKKAFLFFLFVTQELRYGHFIFWTSVSEVRIIVKGRKCQYLGHWAIKKLRTHSFLQLLKFEKAKYPHFF